MDAFEKSECSTIDLEFLKKENFIKRNTKRVKIIGSGGITKSIKFIGIEATKSALEQIKKAGGDLEN